MTERHPTTVEQAGQPDDSDVAARRLWLPWRPRSRPLYPFPRLRGWVASGTNRIAGPIRDRVARSSARLLWQLVLFVLLMAGVVIAVVIVVFGGFAVLIFSLDLLFFEWTALLLLSPFVVAARLAGAIRWVLRARNGETEWVAHVRGWGAGTAALATVREALVAGREPSAPMWHKISLRSFDLVLF